MKNLIYPYMAQKSAFVNVPKPNFEAFIVSVDYGTINPFSAGLWGLKDGVWYRLKEVYWDARETGTQLTDNELFELIDDVLGTIQGTSLKLSYKVIIEAAAASFIETLRRNGKHVIISDSTVKDIVLVQDALKNGSIKICNTCNYSIAEFKNYHWEGSHPYKANDHCMDDIRVFTSIVCGEQKECLKCKYYYTCPNALTIVAPYCKEFSKR